MRSAVQQFRGLRFSLWLLIEFFDAVALVASRPVLFPGSKVTTNADDRYATHPALQNRCTFDNGIFIVLWHEGGALRYFSFRRQVDMMLNLELPWK